MNTVWRQGAARLLMTASGFAGLGYQIVWTQQSALWLGHESAAVLAVVSAFFGGLALGALLMGPRIERSAQALRWYAVCEAVIAAWGLLLLLVMAPFSAWLLDLTGVQPTPWRQWCLAFSGTFLLLLPATAAMGATLPAMERVTSQMRTGPRSIAALYACNTFGAVLGVLGATFWLVPDIGLVRTAMVCVGLNVLCAVLALTTLPAPGEAPENSNRADPCLVPGSKRLQLALAMTGLLGIGYEVVVVRVLSQVAEDTVYTFAMLLAVYLVGTSLGAAAYQRWLARMADAARLTDRLLCALAVACLLGTATLWAAEWLQAWVLHAVPGDRMALAIGAEAFLALMAFGLPTVVMGALFSHLCICAREAGVSFGRSLGVNTLAAALAPPLFGVLLAPALGPKLALLIIALAYLLMATRRTWSTPWAWVPALAGLAMVVGAPQLAFIDIPEGGHIVSYREGVMAAVSVVEDAQGVARLRINNRQQEGSTSSRLVDARQALLPLLLHPAPKRALFLGLGTGVTSGSAAQDPSLQVDVVELLPEVIDASQHFKRVFDGEGLLPQMHVMAADARRYVRTSAQSYDVIVSDNFQPARSGSGALYTVEHFRAVRGRLAEGGTFCQWLPLHQLDLATLRSIVQSFIAVYPQGFAILASNSLETPVLGLVGRADGGRLDVERLRQRLATSQMRMPPAAFGIEDELALLGSVVAGPKALAHFAGQALPNTDDLPVVAYRAPRITYAPDSLPRDRLLAFLNEVSLSPDEVLAAPVDPAWAGRLSAYWVARKQFIEAGRLVRPSSDVQDMLSQVREPLLAVLHISPDFRPAYDPLLHMAGALLNSDVSAGRALLDELVRVQPMRPEAVQLRLQLAD
ncbi:fused MFS/spermidine synthase [Aquabacterium sp. CECT 9606]|uniref:fused MFS/spermidine synthase n=1 Tax=Aquabacterium sp. CECT 9606 TaxID=2845822 RepID=UPI001E57A00F|nr:fused MFS/spermidine synthase [Aquabacterium sp. CECT 9606]CAH0349408.1 Polyamine aminopropyltransferase [Aquabacterium sp. CECT 9606]